MISLRRIAAVVGLALPLPLAAAVAAPAWAGTVANGGTAVTVAGVVRPAVCPLSMTWDGVKCQGPQS